MVDSLKVIPNLVNHMSDEQKFGLLKHDRYGVLSAVLPLLSAELSSETPSEEIIIPLCNISRILQFISSSEDRSVYDIYARVTSLVD